MIWRGSGVISWTTNNVALYDYAQVTFDYNSFPAMYDAAGFGLGAVSLASSGSPPLNSVADWAAGQATTITGQVNHFGTIYTRVLVTSVAATLHYDPPPNTSATNLVGLFIGAIPEDQGSYTPSPNSLFAAIRQMRGVRTREMPRAQIVSATYAPTGLTVRKKFRLAEYNPKYFLDPEEYSCVIPAGVSNMANWVYPNKRLAMMTAGIYTTNGNNFPLNTFMGTFTIRWKLVMRFYAPRVIPNMGNL